MQYKYSAKNKQNEEVSGVIDAESEANAADQLMERELFITALQEVSPQRDIGALITEFFQKVTKKDLAIFLRQLSILISAAVPLVQALKILSDQVENPVLRKALAEIVTDVEGGMKLSMSLEKYENLFSAYFINMVRSGETSGRLEEILNYLADQEEKDYELQSKVIGALVYPGFIMIVMMLGGVFMLLFVLPKMLAMFTELGATAQIPPITQFLILLTVIARSYWWVVLLALFALIVAVRYYMKTDYGRLFLDKFKLKVPVLGQLFQYLYLIRFSRSFNTILVGGITIPQGLRIVRTVIGNSVYENLIDETIKEVEEGNPMSAVFAKSKYIPTMVTQMISVGEQTGRLDDVLKKITDFYSREINGLIEVALKLIEPIIMVILGIAVGFLVAGIILPMFDLSSSVQ
ncbi:MAG: type II secretion system F family protein [Candidatus Uhrbacteria bacterium]|nr:type II secretion system F family protein [Candidatus Uhrbacteria bacterium]